MIMGHLSEGARIVRVAERRPDHLQRLVAEVRVCGAQRLRAHEGQRSAHWSVHHMPVQKRWRPDLTWGKTC